MADREAAADGQQAHISRAGFERDDDGFVLLVCGCGTTIGPAPDHETALDMAMEHAYYAGRSDVAGA